MSKHGKHKSFTEIWRDNVRTRCQNKYIRMRNENLCGNNEWKRVDLHTQTLMCKQTGERCNMATCPYFSKQS